MEPPPFIDVEVRPALRPYVRRVIVTESRSAAPCSSMIAPTGYAYAGWVIRGTMRTFVNDQSHASFREFDVFLAGALDAERVRVDYTSRYSQILAEFSATGLFELLGVKGRSIAGIACPAQTMCLDRFGALRKAGTNVGGENSSMVKLAGAFQDALGAFVSDVRSAPYAVRRAVACFEATDGTATVKEVADQIGMTPDRLRRPFHDIVGLRPKAFARALMFNRAMEMLVTDNRGRLTDLSHSAGYHDQAHFIHVMKQIVGQSPRAYLTRERLFPDELYRRNSK